MATSVEQLQTWLTEARAAYHDLQIGKAAARFRDQSGEEVQYTQANRNALLNYISSLEAQIAAATVNPDAVPYSGPIRLIFR